MSSVKLAGKVRDKMMLQVMLVGDSNAVGKSRCKWQVRRIQIVETKLFEAMTDTRRFKVRKWQCYIIYS